MKLITNNPKVHEAYKSICNVVFIDGGYRDVLVYVRDCIHNGTKLLSHPLSGSVKPNEIPYKSVLISDSKHDTLDTDSLHIIESSIETFDKFAKIKRQPHKANPNEIKLDFMEVDFSLISSAIK